MGHVPELGLGAVVRGVAGRVERGGAELPTFVHRIELEIERRLAVRAQQSWLTELHHALRVSRHASVGFIPRRMNSTVRKPPHTLMFDSPRPVEPAAPMSLSVYWPAPMIGLSPTRPGILNARPEVVVTEEISPWGVTASQLMVPVGRTDMS